MQPCSYCIAGKFGGENVLENLLFFSSVWQKSWRMNRSAKGLSIVTTNLDGFSLQMICQIYQTFYHQTFPLYRRYYDFENYAQ